MPYDHNVKIVKETSLETQAWADLTKTIREALDEASDNPDWLADDLVVWVQAWFSDHDLRFDTHAECIDASDFESWLLEAPGRLG